MADRPTHAEPAPDDNEPPSAAVASRAEGRPPEENDSDDPELQAEVILEESEDRTARRAERADGSAPG